MLAIVGGGTAGMTAALLLAKKGHKVTIFEKEHQLGGLWSSRFDADGYFDSENSCKVYQSSYRSSPALFKLIDTSWQTHFVARHDLRKEWLRPFLSDSTVGDIAKLAKAFFLYLTGIRTYKTVTVQDFLDRNQFSEPCRDWLRATALGGVTGTLRMTVWELFHRAAFNLPSVFSTGPDTLYWNAQPPNSSTGFVTRWQDELERLGVTIKVGSGVQSITRATPGADGPVTVQTEDDETLVADAVFMALPPPQLLRLLGQSDPSFSEGWDHEVKDLTTVLTSSVYEHLGIAWVFDREFDTDLPLGGHCVRSGWYPILVQFPQFKEHLKAPGQTVVTGSLSLNTDFTHPQLGTKARDHDAAELAAILWADQQREDPSLPDPISVNIYGDSLATQIVEHGPLAVKNHRSPLYLATHINGKSPYFTSSLESTIQAGNAAAIAYDPDVLRLPT
jgi:phytoene dehydrogenase-like protein